MDIISQGARCAMQRELDPDPVSSSEALYCELAIIYRTERACFERLASRITRDRASAEDIVQEAFVRACEQAMTVPPPSLRRWMNTVVQRLAVDHARRDATRARSAVALRWLSVDSLEPSHMTCWAWLTFEDVYSAIALLPSRMQPVLRLWCAGASYRAIAAAQRVPVGTVATRVLRARERLRLLLLKAPRAEFDALAELENFATTRLMHDRA